MSKLTLSHRLKNYYYKVRYGHTYDDFITLGEQLAEANRKKEIALSRIEKQYRIKENNDLQREGEATLEAIQEYYPDFE